VIKINLISNRIATNMITGFGIPPAMYQKLQKEKLIRDNEDPDRECSYIVNRSSMGVEFKCHNKAQKGEVFCHQHKNTLCWCGCPATHNCLEREKCDQALCDNEYCNSAHNIDNKHIRLANEWWGT